MSELISKDAALDCFRDWIDQYGHEHTADEDAVYQRIAGLKSIENCADAISRKMAIDVMCEMMYHWFGGNPKDEIREIVRELKKLPAVQPDHNADIGKKVSISCGHENDLIFRQAAIDAIIGQPPEPHYPSWYAAQIEKLPAAQPEQRWIPVTERLPENDNEVLITVWDAEDDYVEVYKGFYQGHEWWTQWCHGCSKIKDEPCGENIVIAWMPLPKAYLGGEQDDR